MSFKVGDIVKHKASFLKSIGWYTGVPRDGMVMEVTSHFGEGGDTLKVMWAGEWKGPTSILPCNVMLASEPDYSGM
jgi:hypothetical protein